MIRLVSLWGRAGRLNEIGRSPEWECAKDAPQGAADGFAASGSVAHLAIGFVENDTADACCFNFFDGSQQKRFAIHPEHDQVAGRLRGLKAGTRIQTGMTHLNELISQGEIAADQDISVALGALPMILHFNFHQVEHRLQMEMRRLKTARDAMRRRFLLAQNISASGSWQASPDR